MHRKLLGIAALSGVYILAGRFGLSLDAVSRFATLVWPPTGIALAALLLFGLPLWPGVFIGAFLVNLLTGAPAAVATGIAAGNTLEAAIGFWLLRRARFEDGLGSLRDVVLLLVFGGLISPVVSCLFGVTSLWLGDMLSGTTFSATASAWWLGNLMGNLIVAPLLLVWGTEFRRKWTLRQAAEAGVLLLLSLIVSGSIFMGAPFFDFVQVHQPYLVFPLILWAGTRFQQRGAVSVTFLLSAMAIGATVSGRGPFASASLSGSLTALQMFMAVVAVTGLVLAAVVEERRAETSVAREAIRARDEFLSIASHELGTPVTSLHLQIHLLERIAQKDPEGFASAKGSFEDAVRRCKNTSARLVAMLEELLDVTRIRAGRLELHREDTDLASVVRSVTEELSAEALRAGSDLIFHDPGIAISGDWDKPRLEQVLSNLVSNAIKYGNGAPIEISVGSDERRAWLEVKDGGLGIPAEMQAKIFERFERAVGSRSISGLGLGLYIVRQIVEAHGGSIRVESRPGNGSRFTVELPVNLT